MALTGLYFTGECHFSSSKVEKTTHRCYKSKIYDLPECHRWLQDNSYQQPNVTTIKAFKEALFHSAAVHLLCSYSKTKTLDAFCAFGLESALLRRTLHFRFEMFECISYY